MRVRMMNIELIDIMMQLEQIHSQTLLYISSLKCVDAAEATAFDVDLLSSTWGYTSDQLMELAGLSCSQTIEKYYPVTQEKHKVIIVCGPGSQFRQEKK